MCDEPEMLLLVPMLVTLIILGRLLPKCAAMAAEPDGSAFLALQT